MNQIMNSILTFLRLLESWTTAEDELPGSYGIQIFMIFCVYDSCWSQLDLNLNGIGGFIGIRMNSIKWGDDQIYLPLQSIIEYGGGNLKELSFNKNPKRRFATLSKPILLLLQVGLRYMEGISYSPPASKILTKISKSGSFMAFWP